MNQKTLHLVSEQTQQIAWASPTQPRFRVTRGGLPLDWTPYFHAAVGISLVGVFILLTIFWPHLLRSSVRPSARVALPPLPARDIARMQAAPPTPLTLFADPTHTPGFRVAPSAPTAGHTLIYHYVN